jgi:peroxiredoxin
MRSLKALWLVALLGACASSPSAEPKSPQPGAAPLSLGLARADGRTIALSAYAGQPLLLFMFATYDEASQLALVTLTQFLSTHSSVQVAGVLLQPDAATFLPLFKEAVPVPFELYYDLDNQILQGESPLGKLQGVPAYVALDAAGRVAEVRYGVQQPDQLETLVAAGR